MMRLFDKPHNWGIARIEQIPRLVMLKIVRARKAAQHANLYDEV
jgi:hypothetical protein